jgi:hypothetical protein
VELQLSPIISGGTVFGSERLSVHRVRRKHFLSDEVFVHGRIFLVTAGNGDRRYAFAPLKLVHAGRQTKVPEAQKNSAA